MCKGDTPVAVSINTLVFRVAFGTFYPVPLLLLAECLWRCCLLLVVSAEFSTIGKNAGISALGIVESRPRLHGQSQGSLPRTPIDQSRVVNTSCEVVSDRLPIRSGSQRARPHQTHSRHGGLPTARCPAAGAASTRSYVKHRVSAR